MMKKILKSCMIILMVNLSCQKQETAKVENKTQDKKIQRDSQKSLKIIKPLEEDNLGDYADLVPIEIIDSSKQNVYEKFGIEFSGNCYSCDLAEIRVNKKSIDFVNICDENELYQIQDYSYTTTNKELQITTNENIITFKKIESAPIYKLIIEGKKMDLKNKRISKYYTAKKTLSKFKEHDCGDFGG